MLMASALLDEFLLQANQRKQLALNVAPVFCWAKSSANFTTLFRIDVTRSNDIGSIVHITPMKLMDDGVGGVGNDSDC
jgi:hypothetical protein